MTFGERSMPVEGFEVDGNWHVEFEPSFWSQIESELSYEAEN
jgi:hypothetical protein